MSDCDANSLNILPELNVLYCNCTVILPGNMNFDAINIHKESFSVTVTFLQSTSIWRSRVWMNKKHIIWIWSQNMWGAQGLTVFTNLSYTGINAGADKPCVWLWFDSTDPDLMLRQCSTLLWICIKSVAVLGNAVFSPTDHQKWLFFTDKSF